VDSTWFRQTYNNDPVDCSPLTDNNRVELRTFLLVDFVPSSSVLLFAAGFATALGFFTFGSSVTGCDEILVDRRGVGSSPSTAAGLRGGITVW
jgi:hypothetical protein